MRTTVTLDPDVEAQLRAIMRELLAPLSTAGNLTSDGPSSRFR